ncbi:ABC transporter ATP-binding protein, partial [Streptomyces sp. SID10244]|nr:ABC transporter ATP-binding protein [Streptomyces sp. SID10244]
MSMESVGWDTMYKSMNAPEARNLRGERGTTLRRIAGFARPHRRRIAVFLGLSVLTALLTVVTPLLAGRVVNLITGGGSGGAIAGLALVIALIAVIEAAAGIGTRWFSANIGEGLILDLRRSVFDHVQKMPVA